MYVCERLSKGTHREREFVIAKNGRNRIKCWKPSATKLPSLVVWPRELLLKASPSNVFSIYSEWSRNGFCTILPTEHIQKLHFVRSCDGGADHECVCVAQDNVIMSFETRSHAISSSTV